MAITIQPENSVIIDVKRALVDWCAFEHIATLKAGEPPQTIFVGACRAVDVYKLQEGKSNSQWAKIYAQGGNVLLRILATGPDRSEIINYAVKVARGYNPPPVCNLHGYTMAGALRRIACSNGEVYDSQAHAAAALGTHQSAVSRHLQGHSAHVKGHTLTYVGAE